jgi:hypothetical protein
VEELDLSTFYLLVIAALVALVALLFYRLIGMENEMKGLRQGMGSKMQAVEDPESKPQTIDTIEGMLKEIKGMREDFKSKFDELSISGVSSETPAGMPKNLGTRVDRALSGLEFLGTYFRIQSAINDYGSRIREVSYEFMSRVEDALRTLESGEVVGSTYVLMSNMLLFSLMMAKIYLQTVGPQDSLPMIENYIGRAKRLV